MTIRRRSLLAGSTMLLGAGLPAIGRAQGAPITLGILTALTGAGAADGPRMAKAMQAVGSQINAAGGLNGRPLRFVVEDDQTNPEGAVRAARKLVDVDKVPVIMGTWASAVTSAVAPVCWESRTFLTTCSGADTITQLPHDGYLIRTQPNSQLQGRRHAEFMGSLGAKRVFVMSLQSPFALPTQNRIKEVLPQHGSEMVGALIYEKDKSSYRSEIDQALKTKPDMMYLNGYSPDLTVLLRELYRAGYEGGKFSQSYALTEKVVESLPKEVVEGAYNVQPSADADSPAFENATKLLGHAPDSYEAQSVDWISLVALTIAKAAANGEPVTGKLLRDNVRRVSQGDGEKVYTVLDGLKLLSAGKEINYQGVSGPCDFTPIGDIEDCRFRFSQVKGGKINLLKVS